MELKGIIVLDENGFIVGATSDLLGIAHMEEKSCQFCGGRVLRNKKYAHRKFTCFECLKKNKKETAKKRYKNFSTQYGRMVRVV